jgi:hypothetical protein
MDRDARQLLQSTASSASSARIAFKATSRTVHGTATKKNQVATIITAPPSAVEMESRRAYAYAYA